MDTINNGLWIARQIADSASVACQSIRDDVYRCRRSDSGSLVCNNDMICGSLIGFDEVTSA